jgi:hypothetical protein
MYQALEARVLAEEAEKKEKEKARRVSQGLPAEEGGQFSSPRVAQAHATVTRAHYTLEAYQPYHHHLHEYCLADLALYQRNQAS